jgi:hypothetical protein
MVSIPTFCNYKNVTRTRFDTIANAVLDFPNQVFHNHMYGTGVKSKFFGKTLSKKQGCRSISFYKDPDPKKFRSGSRF